MGEYEALARALLDAQRGGRTRILATLVRLEGSGYRRPGARMLITGTERTAGFLSGGCLEGDVAERARRVAEGAEPFVVTYDTRTADDLVWGLASGCNGIVDVLLEPVPPPQDPGHPARLAERVAARRPGALATVFRAEGAGAPPPGSRLLVEPDGSASGPLASTPLAAALGTRLLAALAAGAPRSERLESSGVRIDVLLEPVVPPPRIVLAGAGPDADALARLAVDLGWQTAVVDPRGTPPRPERFADDVERLGIEPEAMLDRLRPDGSTAVVVMTHNFHLDARLLRVLLPSDLPYVGLLGPRARRAALLEALERDGFRPEPDAIARLRGPVGFDLGATTPEEIALSILAEVRAVLSGRPGGPLTERDGPIHVVAAEGR